jgi:hypothetical protein
MNTPGFSLGAVAAPPPPQPEASSPSTAPSATMTESGRRHGDIRES